jgi:hypothetical protein
MKTIAKHVSAGILSVLLLIAGTGKASAAVLYSQTFTLLVVCFVREASERAFGSDGRAGKWGVVIVRLLDCEA